MSSSMTKGYRHACPRNCPSSCTMISTVENNQLINLQGDRNHPYTKGKLCSKGYAYIERNYHPDRLKFPYYQEEKGSGKFKRISWEKAFELIIDKMVSIHKRYGNFLPLALYKYTGNQGIHHRVTDDFFSSLGKTTRIIGKPCSSTSKEAIQYDLGAVRMSSFSHLTEAQLIIIWGANPAATNIHLIPHLLKAKKNGAKIVVIDPIFTQTADLADLFIQIKPSTDGALANLLLKELFDSNHLDQRMIEEHSFGFNEFIEEIKKIDVRKYRGICEIPEEATSVLLNWLKEANTVAYLIGLGLPRHSNGGQSIRAIQSLAFAHGDIGKKGGGIFCCQSDSQVFANNYFKKTSDSSITNRHINMNEWIKNGSSVQDSSPLEMMWISCRNPLTQDPQPQLIRNHLKEIPFVVTVEQFLTPTAAMSNLVLPTTSHFEEMDVVISWYHNEVALNEKAIPPYYESRSEWAIMQELAKRLNDYSPSISSFPMYSSEEDYLNSTFNEKVYDIFHIRSIADLKAGTVTANIPEVAWSDYKFPTQTGKYQFYSPEAEENGKPPMPLFVEGKRPTAKHPFWLITPHHPYAINSQFHFLNLSNGGEGEAFVAIHADVAKELGIFNGEIVKVYNDHASIMIKAVYSQRVPKDIVMIYAGWYPNLEVHINELIPVIETDMGEMVSGANGVAYNDTFVNVGKL